MDEKNAAWLMFEITGKVEDYVKYCGYKEKKNEFQSGRNSVESEKDISRESTIFNDSSEGSRFN